MAEFQPGTADQTAFLNELFDGGLLIRTGTSGVYGRGRVFEDIRLRFDELVTRCSTDQNAEPIRFPPVLPRGQFETSGYLKSFPHLAGGHLRLRRDRGAGPRAVRARDAPRGLERTPEDDRAGPRSSRLLPDLPGDRRPRPAAAGRRHDRSGRLVRLPPRALRRPCPAPDVPHARAHPHGRAGDGRRPGATSGCSADSTCCAGSGLDAGYDVAADPFFGRSGRMLAASQREQALKVEILVQIARRRRPRRSPPSTTTRRTSRTCIGLIRVRRRRGPHRVPRLRARADRAGAAANARTRCRVLAGRGPARSSGDEHVHGRAGQPVRPRSGDLPPHAVHAGGQTYHETNCYTDILIELLHARGDEPLAVLGSTVRLDFEGDQWTFFKPHPADLEGLFGIDIHEMQPYRPLPSQIAGARSARAGR